MTYIPIMKKPVLAITIGDPSGVGPEIVSKSLAEKKIYQYCNPLVIGDAQILSLQNYGVSLKIRPILNPAQAQYRYGTIDILHLPCPKSQDIPIGRPNKISGEISAQAVKKSVELAITKLVHGIVHAPISKTAWNMAEINYPGHTEMIAKLCGIKKVAMAIVSEPLRIVMVTRHLALNQVAQHLHKQEIVNVIMLANQWMRQMNIPYPKIGVCALNPHAGENGLLGKEEIKIISPAVRQAKIKLEKSVIGPLPADSAFRDLKRRIYDCLVTMYHDQSLIPLKLFDPEKLVNITLGLPFPRTSPGHGTAFEIAGKNRANPKPMIEAILTAAKLCTLIHS